MKKILIIIVSILLISSCKVYSDYSVRFVDLANPSDTLVTNVTLSENILVESGLYSYFLVECRNKGTVSNPVYVYSLLSEPINGNPEKIYSSTNSITIIDFKYLGQGRKQ